MKRLLGALALVAFACTGAYATEDVSPIAGVPNYGDGTFPIVATIPLDINNHCVGVGWDGEYLWVSAGDATTGQCEFYWFLEDGTMVDNQPQGAGATGWGHRDMCYDGEYVFGSYSYSINGFTYPPLNHEGYLNGPISPNRAEAHDGTYFYVCGFGEYLYQLDWDGVWGSTAGVTNLGGPWDGAYGLAYDYMDDCLYMTTADYSGNIFKIGMDGSLIETYTSLPEHDIHGGCTMACTSYGYVLVVLWQASPDTLVFYDLGHGPSAAEDGTWGSIKALFR